MLNVRSRPDNKLTKMHSTPRSRVNPALSEGSRLLPNILFFKWSLKHC
jgi:hypothetical protein